MATSGSFNTSGYDGRYLTFSWEVKSQSITDNTTTISWKLKGAGNPNKGYYLTQNIKVTIDGVTVFSHTKDVNGQIQLRDGTEVANGTYTLKHNDEGKHSFTAYAEAGIYNWAANYNGSDSWELPQIARASAITSAADVTLGNACSVKWIPMSASFRYKLKFACGNWSHTTEAIHPNKNTEYVYSGYVIPIEVANQIKKRTGKMTVTMTTYSDSGGTSAVGSADTEEFTVTVPETDDTRPSVTSMSLSPVSDLKYPFNTLYIQGRSKVAATMEFSTKYGASVDDSNITVEGIVYPDPYESGLLTKTGEQEVKGLVKDSREYYGTIYQKITVIPYSKPAVQAASGETNIVAARCDANGKLTDSGTYLKIKAKLIYEKVMSDVQNNFGKIQYRYRAEGGLWSDWYTILDARTSTDTEVTTAPLLGTLSIKTNYQVQVKAIDDLEESEPVTFAVPSDEVYMDRPAGGRSMGLGGYSSGNGRLDVYWKTMARGGLSLFDSAGNELPLEELLPLPRGPLGEDWNPNSIANGVHEVGDSPLKDSMGNTLMDTGALIQLPVTADGFVRLQLAFPTDSLPPVYRLFWYGNWTDWIEI